MSIFRIGHGYDIHRLVKGRKLILGGVRIENEMGLEGHSDADVIVHALMDSLLGAAALGDIGIHFPDSDPAYKDSDSLKLLSHVRKLLGEHGYSLENIDITAVAESPRLSPYIPQMISTIARVLEISLETVSIKATTSEGLGFIGRGEGIAAFCVALLRK